MKYEVKDNSGSVIERFDDLERAKQFLANNSDIADKVTQGKETIFVYNEQETLILDLPDNSFSAVDDFVTITSIPKATAAASKGLLTAEQARAAIQKRNEELYDSDIANYIAKLIEEGGDLTVEGKPNTYITEKLKALGYSVSLQADSIKISIQAAAFLVPTVTTQREQTSELLEQMKQTKLYKSQNNT